MASNPAKAKGSRWGSLLSGAVAGLESRLDNIFAEEEERAAKERAAAKAAPVIQQGASGVSTPTNDRLKERLAKAVAKSSSQPSSELPSRSGTPLLDTGLPSRSITPLLDTGSPRTSIGSRPSADLPTSTSEPAGDIPLDPSPEPSASLLTSGLPINPARISNDTSRPFSIQVDHDNEANEANGDATIPRPEPRSDLEAFQPSVQVIRVTTESEEEMHAHLERIDALQAKLQYLARETVAAAKEANASASPGSAEQKIAEKDERIALLMEEGNKLSKTEMRNLAIIKKLRVKAAEEEKVNLDLQKRLSKLEEAEADLKQKLKQADQAEKLANERQKRLQQVERSLETIKNELESSQATITVLRKQLSDAEKRADEAEEIARKNASQVDTKKVTDLQDQIADLRIEKKLAEDRLAAEAKRSAEQTEKKTEQFVAREAELMTEVSNMESRMEALRSRAEAATSDFTGDAQAKLLRQVETLQTQYSLAAENWRTIEGSLNSRIAAIEKERDEFVKREADMRKKARDVSSKSRKVEEELERMTEEFQSLTQQLQTRTDELNGSQARLTTMEKALEESKAEFDRQRRIMETEYEQKLEEEKSRQVQPGLGINTDMGTTSRTHSPTSHFRKPSAHDTLNPPASRRNLQRIPSHEHTSLSLSRRQSALGTPTLSSPGVSRQGSGFSLSQLNGLTAGMAPTPSIHTTAMDDDDGFDGRSSPQRTINDVISASTVHTGPSVQLVERMSSSIRRLESEKAAHKDELARLVSQRDESRNEVVALMREAESKRQADNKASKLEAELAETKKRYEACLEMLGEREEQVEELKGDVVELKRIYRDLADRSLK